MIDAIDGLGGHHLSQPQYWRGSRPVRFHAASLSWDRGGHSVEQCGVWSPQCGAQNPAAHSLSGLAIFTQNLASASVNNRLQSGSQVLSVSHSQASKILPQNISLYSPPRSTDLKVSK